MATPASELGWVVHFAPVVRFTPLSPIIRMQVLFIWQMNRQDDSTRQRNHRNRLVYGHANYKVVHKFCNKLKCEYLPMNRRQMDTIYMECITHLGL